MRDRIERKRDVILTAKTAFGMPVSILGNATMTDGLYLIVTPSTSLEQEQALGLNELEL